jgi:two-component system OmpR family response regulator
MAATILVVEDDPAVALALEVALKGEGYLPLMAATGDKGLEIGMRQAPDLLILDVRLPGIDGFELLRRLRAGGSKAPVIILTARDEEVDTILGLELGADDYLPKPCNPRELLARVRAVLRRAAARGQDRGAGTGCEFAGWKLDLVRRELRTPDGVMVHLSSGEFALLRTFVERAQRVLTRDQLLDMARGPESDAFDRAIDVQISRLRRKLEDGAPGQNLIRTIRNEGYMFIAKVRKP